MAQLFLLLPLLYILLQWAALSRMHDGWQIAATIPAVAMAAALVVLVMGILTNAGMAAAGLVIGLPVATVYLVLLWSIHLLLQRR